MSSVSRTVSQAQVMSAAMASLNEFRLSGRFSVMVATLSATSNRMASRSMHSSWAAVRMRREIVHSFPGLRLGLRASQHHTTESPSSGTEQREDHAVEIKGKKAVIVGGASGMAKASAELLRQKGADIAILDLPNTAGAEVAAELDGTFHEVNVLDDAQVESALADAVAALGGLHIAVNTAGGGIAKRTLTKEGPHPIEEFRRTIELNLVGHVQPEPPAGLPHVEQRARGRRAGRHHRHRLHRRLRRPDRPGGVLRSEGRHRRA